MTHVLMVEDNPVDLDLLRLAFDRVSDWPLTTTVVNDGEKAIELLRDQAADLIPKPDLVILDLNLPRRDGTEVLQMIRSTEGIEKLPVVILSSSPRDIIQGRLTNAGVRADGHFRKPLDLEEFLVLGEVLRAWYTEHQQRRREATIEKHHK